MTSLQRWAVALAAVLVSATAMAGGGGPSPVPEPGTLGLMAVGVVALVATTLRKRK